MTSISSFIYRLLLLSLISFHAYSNSPVWKVSHSQHHFFIAGTVHLLAKEDYPLPKEFDQAYGKSDILILEADTSQMQTPAVQQAMLNKAMYPDGVTIQSKLTAATYQALSDYCLSQGLDIKSLERFKPGLLSVMLSVTEMKRLNIAGIGVDEHFNQKARSQHVTVKFLESLEKQLSLIANMGINQEEAFIKYTLEETKHLESMINILKDSWRQGDLGKLNEVAIMPLKQEFPELYTSLLVNRNNDWLPQLRDMLKTKEVELVLVGALHLAGHDGLISLLKNAGYKVERFKLEPNLIGEVQ